jgi:hypothetical protein
MISPIPLWAHFNLSSFDYHWIKGYNGIYQVIVLPLFFAGLLKIFQSYLSDWKRSLPMMFLLIYLLLNSVGVLATSLEQRHIGQFLSAFVIIAALPNTTEEVTEITVRRIKIFWFFGVFLLHLAWVILKVI